MQPIVLCIHATEDAVEVCLEPQLSDQSSDNFGVNSRLRVLVRSASGPWSGDDHVAPVPYGSLGQPLHLGHQLVCIILQPDSGDRRNRL